MYKKIDWNTVWETEKNNDYWKKPDTDLVEFIKTLPQNITSVLDLGCGLGRHSIYCARQGFHVTAMDVSERAIGYLIEWARKEKLAVTAYVGDIFSDKIKDQKFDMVVSINVIYHGTRSEIVQTIKGIHAKLPAGGLFYLTFLTRDDDKYGIGKEIEPHTFLCDTSVHEGDIHYFADGDDFKDLLKDFDIICLKKDDHEWEYKGETRHSSFWKATLCKRQLGLKRLLSTTSRKTTIGAQRKLNTVQLPNGDTIYSVDRLTPLIYYKEIFEQNVYLQNGIFLEEGDVVFDVGGFIGLFSLYLCKHFKNLDIYTFEPLAPMYNALCANLKNQSCKVTNFHLGLSDRKGSADFFYYPFVPGISCMIPVDNDKFAQWILDNYDGIIHEIMPLSRFLPKFLRPLGCRLGVRLLFTGKKVTCELETISNIIADYNIGRIDLLKIDAENCEKLILDGIEDKDWDKIKQIAMEVHGNMKDSEQQYMEIRQLLESRGFKIKSDDIADFKKLGVIILYARRS